MTRPRVIFINRVYWPSLAATSQLLTDLAEGLAARGWPVHIIAAGHEAGPRNDVIIHRTGEGDRHGGLISRARNYTRFIRQVRRELETLVQPGDRVVVMTDPPLLGAAVTPVAVKRGAQVIHWTQDIYPEIVAAHFGALAGALLFPLRARRDAAWRAAGRCVVLGETMAGTVKGHGVPADRVITIANWAPRELHRPSTEEARFAQRAAWGLADKFVVAYSGNLGRVHEFKAILGAADILRDRPDIAFLFLGTGARLAEVRSIATKTRLRNLHILPPAPRENLAASLASADVQLVTLNPAFAPLVYPSKLAGVLAAGRPTIFVGPPDGEIASLLKNGNCGAAVAPSDGPGLAQLITRWQADPVESTRIAQNARDIHKKHFVFESALARWEDALV
ncbi:MAG TPA: glycosyltransferase family 4 protein [Lacunisphaera sp.]|jgi:glycosyltransferase involved in cell wall biosynthesis